MTVVSARTALEAVTISIMYLPSINGRKSRYSGHGGPCVLSQGGKIAADNANWRLERVTEFIYLSFIY